MKYFKKFEIYLSVKIKFMQTNLVRPDHKKNGQTHPKNSSARADELFLCLTIFCG